MKATKTYGVVLSLGTVCYNVLYKVVLTLESVGEILKFDYSNERYCAELFCGTVYHVVQSGSNF